MPKRKILYVAMLLGFAVFSYLTRNESTGFAAKQKMVLANSSEKETQPILSVLKENSSLSSTLLIDSIISIVQSYYVDSERVDNQHVLSFTVDSLKASGYIDAVTREDQLVKIKVDGITYSYYDSEKIGYNELIGVLVGLSSVLDQTIKSGKSNNGEVEDIKNLESGNAGATVVLNSLLKALDAHSRILSEEAYKELKQGTEGTFGGLGVLVGIRDQTLTVIKPIPNSPASRFGIKKDDKILSIDGVETFGFTLDQLVEYMRGEPGSVVNLSLLKQGAESASQIKLKREVIQVDSVESKTLTHDNGKALYISIESFSSRTASEVMQAMNEHRKKYGSLEGIVLDLRSNPGGLLDQAVLVADLFLNKGVIVSTKGLRQEFESASPGKDEENFPIVALVNSDSASASEIVVGALQDHRRAVVVGQPSFGKGSVQTVFELPGEKALKLTIARYYTPSGRTIQNVGITPDVWIQPVYKMTENTNLLGYNRYRNEMFLENHLRNKIKVKTSTDPLHESKFKSFYLVDPEKELALGDNKEDRELNVALDILSSVNKIYGTNLPLSAQRSTHWLGLASSKIEKKLNTWSTESKEYLANNFHLQWDTDRLNRETEGLNLSKVEVKEKTVESSKELLVDYQIVNTSNFDMKQVSLFAMSEGYVFDTREYLVGTISAHSTKNGTLKIRMPGYVESGSYQLDIGIASSGRAITDANIARIEFDVKKREMSNLISKVDLVEEVGGKEEGILESGENAYLKVQLFNDSKVDAQDVNVRVLNLAGMQVEIDSTNKKIEKILAGKKHELLIKLKGSKSILTDKLGFGLSVESGDLFSALREKISIKGHPLNNERLDVLAH